MSDKMIIAQIIEQFDELVRDASADDRGVEPCIALADAMIEHWDTIIKPLLRRAL